MMFGQYCRIESRAGGVGCTEREFIRAALSMINKESRRSRDLRIPRRAWLRDGLKMRLEARGVYRHVTGGI